MASVTLKRGLVNLPGVTYASSQVTQKLLLEDYKLHHCFFNKLGFHNHLSHHLLAAYDLGATPSMIQKMYDTESLMQRPVDLGQREHPDKDVPREGEITEQNWTKWLDDERTYAAYLAFFTSEMEKHGIIPVVEKYVFSPAANGNNTLMLIKLMSGAVHPFIQVGYGLEFGSISATAQGLALAAAERASTTALWDINHNSALPYSSTPPTVLTTLREMYDSSILHPVMPYDPDSLLRHRVAAAMKDGRPEEIHRLAAQWTLDPADPQLHEKLSKRVEEFIWTATLLTFATGKEGRKPRLDFFLMHLLTSSIFLQTFVDKLTTPRYKIDLLRAYLPTVLSIVLIRGRPRINPALLMTYTDYPQPPNAPNGLSKAPGAEEGKDIIGDPTLPSDINPWSAIIESAFHHTDSHVIKALRSLVYAAQRFGDTPPGGVIGAVGPDGKETHNGALKLDGSIFVRSAGIMMDSLGWVNHGQKEGQWDRSALGWEGAWANED